MQEQDQDKDSNKDRSKESNKDRSKGNNNERMSLKVHKIEIFFGFDFEICIISLLVM